MALGVQGYAAADLGLSGDMSSRLFVDPPRIHRVD